MHHVDKLRREWPKSPYSTVTIHYTLNQAGPTMSSALGLPDDFALDVHRHQAGRRDLLVEQAVEIDEEMVLFPWDARGDVVV